MKILFINWFGLNHVGGVEIYLKNLVDYLNTYGIEANVLVGKPKGKLSIHEKLFKCLSYNKHFKQSYFKKEIGAYDELFRNTDIIHFQNPHLFMTEQILTLYNYLQDHFPEKILIASLHNMPKNLDTAAKILKLFKGYIIVPSKYLELVLKKRFCLDGKTLPYYFKLPKFPLEGRRSIGDDSIRFLQPTRFSNWKGSHLSLKVVCDLLDEGYTKLQFAHAGISQKEVFTKWDSRWDILFPDLKARVKKYLRSKNISFFKYNFEDTYKVFNKYDYILHPSTGKDYEGDPNPIAAQQAVVNNHFIIVSDSGNLPTIIRKYRRSSLVNANDELSYYKTIKRIIQEHPKYCDFHCDKAIDLSLRHLIESSPERHIKYYYSVCRQK